MARPEQSASQSIRGVIRATWGDGSVYESLFDALAKGLKPADRQLFPTTARRLAHRYEAQVDDGLLWFAASAGLFEIRFIFHEANDLEHELSGDAGWRAWREGSFVSPDTGQEFLGDEFQKRLLTVFHLTDQMRAAVQESQI